MTDSPVSLASLMLPEKTVTVGYPGCSGWEIDVCFLARESLIKLRKRCVTTKFDKKTRQPEEVLDEEKFLVEYCKASIKGWEGLKFSYLKDLLLIDVSSVDPDSCLPYTLENAELLMRNSGDFDSWITETVGDLENFTGNK
jgi:hypothetical protein